MTVFVGLSSGLLGVILVVLGWLLKNAKLISEILSILPAVQRDVELVKEHLTGDKKNEDDGK
jgi:hypothetical protein